jgi:hypothetical protein
MQELLFTVVKLADFVPVDHPLRAAVSRVIAAKAIISGERSCRENATTIKKDRAKTTE